MNAEEEQRLHNLEVAVMALFTHLIDGGLNIDAIHRDLFNCNSAMGGMRDAEIIIAEKKDE